MQILEHRGCIEERKPRCPVALINRYFLSMYAGGREGVCAHARVLVCVLKLYVVGDGGGGSQLVLLH